MKIRNKIILAFSALCFTQLLYAQTYIVDTPNFVDVFGAYSTNYNIVGTFTTDGPLNPVPGIVDIKDKVVAYNFTDGVQTITHNNSTILFFAAEVDQLNQMTGAAITIWRSPITTISGENVSGMDIYISPTFAQVFGFLDGECSDASGPGGVCISSQSTSTNSGTYLFYDEIFQNGFDF